MFTPVKVGDVRSLFAEILPMIVADGYAHRSVYLLPFNDFPHSLHNIEKSIVLSIPCFTGHWFCVCWQYWQFCKWSIFPGNWAKDDRYDRGFLGFMSLQCPFHLDIIAII